MGCVQSPQPMPHDELSHYKKMHALLIAEAEESQKKSRSRHLHSPIQELLDTQIPFSYIAFGGQYCTNTFVNTCYLDSLLAGCHIAACVHPNIAALFMQDNTINAVMNLLNSGKYAEAKALWLISLVLRTGRKNHSTETDYTDISNNFKDHLPNFLDLTRIEPYYNEDRGRPSLKDDIHMMTMSKFEVLGDVTTLGSRINPKLILVDADNRMTEFSPPMIPDVYERNFKLQFLLLGKKTPNGTEMVVCTSLDGGWWLYDSKKPSLIKGVNMEDIQTQGYAVHLAAYVNVTAKNGN